MGFDNKFKLIFNQLPYPVLVITNDREAVYVNPSYTEVLGYEKNDMYPMDDYLNMIYPDERYRSMINTYWDVYKKKRITFSDIYVQMAKDGSEKKLKVKFIPITEDYNMICYEDITIYIKTLDELNIAHSRYKTISDVTLEGVIITKQGIIVELNKAACSMFALSYKELIGKKETDL